MKRTFLWLALCAALAACHVSEAPEASRTLRLSPSAERQVNSFTGQDQQWPDVASNSQGDAVIVWDSYGQDGSHFGVYGQRFKNGVPVGPEFRANTYTTNRQNFAAVAMDGAGNFVVAWRSSRQQSNGGTIFAQRFAADGSPLGAEFQVGPADSDYDSQSDPAVAMNRSGDFVIAWSNRELSEAAIKAGLNNVETRMIQARVYAADGTARTNPFDVMVRTPLSIVRVPAVAMDDAGKFAVAWISETNPTGIRLQRFAAAGSPSGVATTVSDARDDAEFDHPALAMNPAGDFVVGWEAVFYGSGLPDGIFFKRYTVTDGVYGAQQKAGIAGKAPDFYERAAVALGEDGEVLVAGQGNDRVYVQAFGRSDNPETPVQVSKAAYAALFPAVSIGAPGQAIVAWQSFGEDGDGRGVFMTTVEMR